MTMANAAANANATANAAPARERSALPSPGARAVFRSEMLKLRSVRSVWIMLAAAVVLAAALSLSYAHDQASIGSSYVSSGQDGFGTPNQSIYPAHANPTGTLLSGYVFGAALFAAFGAIAGALEYTSGMIRISLVAVPGRIRFFLCKAAAIAVTAAVAAAVCTLACFLTGESFFTGQPQDAIGVTSPGVPLHLVGAVLCLTGWALIGFALGVLVRSTALGVTLSFGLYIALPLIAESVDPDRANNVTPTQAGQALWIYHNPLNSDIAPFPLGLAVFVGYIAVLLAAAFARIRYTDA